MGKVIALWGQTTVEVKYTRWLSYDHICCILKRGAENVTNYEYDLAKMRHHVRGLLPTSTPG